MQPIRVMVNFPQNKEVEPVQAVELSIYQINACRKELGRLNFFNEVRVQGGSKCKANSPTYMFPKLIQHPNSSQN